MIREIKDHSSDDKRNKDVLNFLDFKIPCCHMEHDPAEADKLLRIQRDLDETKIILHKTIDGVLAQGEKLDSLVEKNSDLSVASQVSPYMLIGRKLHAKCVFWPSKQNFMSPGPTLNYAYGNADEKDDNENSLEEDSEKNDDDNENEDSGEDDDDDND
ncbi:uncharacterized protein LOC120259536 isoform X2 [Dioscorea cayenensis subsp. rotundata]|uniref:Uncharacterized protein LOC120259536 isoform X2 n=1 Tax=Dioscorea cayennensis subsp. rotundata TaxID=55577 RepID=A0AB40B7X2_DIOCR|nr:uncharacterized protein LOC120259536 isoform X2 [Dioscorea cayenensis subsp. rotundata]